MLRELFTLLKALTLAAIIALLMVQFVVQPTIVEGTSMEPGISNGERLLINKVVYRFSSPQRGDIIVLKTGEEDRPEYLKRIVGLPEEEIEIKRGRTYIDGVLYDEPYIKEYMVGQFGPEVVPPGKYFVLGDNRNNSLDSRASSLGFITSSQISGRADIVFWPVPELKVLAGSSGP